MQPSGVIILFYDLPNKSKLDGKRYRDFRKYLVKEGFQQIQESVYAKFLYSSKSKNAVIKEVVNKAPPNGKVCLLPLAFGDFKKLINVSGEPFDFNLFSDNVLVV